MKTENDRSLIIFARYPRAGEVKTRLGAGIGMAEAAKVYKQLAEHVFEIGKEMEKTGIRVWLFYDPSASEQEMRAWVGQEFVFCPQEGSNLGERMHNAFRRTFAGGSSRSIIVGTDIPNLEAAVITEAFDLLELDEVVLGPSEDGGYYLLGMIDGVGDLFSGIAWSTPDVFPATLARVRGLKLRHSLLATLADIDTKEDLVRFSAWFGKS